jgi:hypothetical protein
LKIIKILFIFLICLNASIALGQKQGLLNKLLSPGPLMIGHQKLEHVDCLSCHEAGEGVPDLKCLSCHKEIQKSIKKKKSFHGKRDKTCIECHSDHKGRNHDSTIVDEKEFDHKETGYTLAGKHKDIKCIKCHETKRKKKDLRKNDPRWFGNGTSCKECHQKDSKHYYTGKWKKMDCGECHNEKKWKDIHDFDHNKDTEFELKGKHLRADCAKCHVIGGKKRRRGKYKWKNLKQKKCIACHKDQHKNKFSKKMRKKECLDCHTENEWKIKYFKHKITGFKLEGKHKKTKCSKCHAVGKKSKNKIRKIKDWVWKGQKKNCIECHKDYHGFGKKESKRFKKLTQCKTCHQQENWKDDIDFDHNFDTKWKINGQHKKLACFQCHVPQGRKLKLKYKAGEMSFFNKKKDKINITRNYHWKRLKEETCKSCHLSPHLKTFKPKLLKKKCTDCHNTKDWHTIRKGSKNFNHDIDTDFKITGKHKTLNCDKCHVRKGKQYFKFKNAAKQYCISCHKNVHKQQFSKKFSSKSCNECHSTKNFKKIKRFNHKKTRFNLTGKHKYFKTKCSKCHVKSKFVLKTKPPKKGNKYLFKYSNEGFCESCHKNEHKNQFHKKFNSLSCTECHITSTFRKIKKFDHNRARFKLKNKHLKLKCTKCHRDTKKRFKIKPRRFKKQFIFKNIERSECTICHKDVHKGSYGKACSNCHNSKSWKSTADFHKNFTLSGIHYSLQCNECHVDNRTLGGMSESCHMCHQKDDIHQGTLPDCGECHRQQFWETTAFRHSLTNFPLRGAHRAIDCASCHTGGVYQGAPSECINCHLSDTVGTAFDHSVTDFDCAKCHNQFIFLTL